MCQDSAYLWDSRVTAERHGETSGVLVMLFLDVGVYSLWKSLSRSFVICTVFYMNVTLQKTSPKCPSGVPQQTAEPEWPQVRPGAPAFKKFPFQVFLKTIGL